VVRDHEVGPWMGIGIPVPKEAGHRATGRRAPGVDSLASNTTEGRSLDNPKRGSSDDRADEAARARSNRKGGESGKQAGQ
jgi:hypothetical protein